MGHRVRQAVPLHVGRVCLSRRENGELSEELRPVAKRVIWFEEPEEALKYPKRFLTYLMTYRTTEDVEVARRHYNRRRLRGGADDPAPGIFYARSWREWNIRYHRVPVPPLPKQVFPGESPAKVRDSPFAPRR